MSGEFDDAITRLEGEIAIRQEEIAVRQAALNALRALDGSGEVPPAPAHRPAPAPQRAAAVSHARHSDASQDDEMTRQVLLAVQTSRTPLSSPEIQRAAKLTSVTRPTITKDLVGPGAPEARHQRRLRALDEVSAGLRQRKTSYGQPTEMVETGTSWWLGKSRAELSAEAEARARDMSKTAIGRTVVGRVNTP